MTASNFQVNTFTGGMNADTDIAFISNDSYRYAENIRIMTNDSGTNGVLLNIEGVKKYNISIPEDETVIGTTTINDIAIVFTRLSNGYTKVYKITNFDLSTPDIKIILQGDLGLCVDLDTNPNLSIVSNYETDTNIKVYFTDGNSGIKMLNIMDDKYIADSSLVDSDGNILNPLALDLTPGSDLPPFKIMNLDSGNLPSGVVLYCYQLFNVHGSETVISPLSTTVHLTLSSTNNNSQEYMGSYPNTSSGKSCNIKTDFLTKDFDKCRIIRILYIENNSIPQIIIVDEILLLPTYDEINYTDTGNSYLGEMTIDEFNLLSSYQFKATSLEKMLNRLFVANVTEETWDPGFYDARAYRCNPDGRLVLQSANKLNDIVYDNFDDVDLSTIPETHDCINPYNSTDLSHIEANYEYAYTKTINGKRILGGSGLNISYSFVTVPIVLSDKLDNWRLNNDCSMNVSPVQMNSILATEVGTDSSKTIMFNDNTVVTRLPNYADPYIDSNFRGYQRDEVYRFGIIFYNNKTVPSPVYWIGDIKIPHAGLIPTFEYKNNLLIGNAIGIKFTVLNIPDGSVSYEIVRCDRTESDRTVIMQGIVTNLYTYKILDYDKPGEGAIQDNSIEMRPFVFPEYDNSDISQYIVYNRALFSYDDVDSITSELERNNLIPEYVRFISPEVCLNQSNSELYFKDSVYLDCIGNYYSPILNDGDSQGDSYTRIYASADSVLLSDGTNASVRKSDEFVYKQSDTAYQIKVAYRKKNNDDNVSYTAHIFKYYVPDMKIIRNLTFTPTIINAAYPEVIPYNGINSTSAYKTNVGERTYTGVAITTVDESADLTVMGIAGPCMIMSVDNMRNYYNGVSSDITNLNEMDKHFGVALMNVKRSTSSAYGGNTYVSRLNSVYISTNSYNRLEDSSNTEVITYGGDTYLGLLDYPNVFTYLFPDEQTYSRIRKYIGAYIPFESSINMNLFNGDMPHMTYTSDNYIDSHMQMEITLKGNYHVLEKPYFVYNTVYSSQLGSRKFVPKSIYDESNMRITNRIMVSLAKTNNEILDNWTVFKTADYLDVDSQYGKITNLKKFKDRLFYFLDTAVGIAAVNERALITDDNIGLLTLGTGGILSRFDYITTLNGTSIVNDRSIVNSDNVLYWYDYDKNEICAYNGSVNQISKEKMMQSYLNEMYGNKRNVNLSLFDKKYNEVWFKFYDKSLIFNELLGKFTSFYTFNPDWSLLFSDKIVTLKDNDFYVINSLDTDGLGEIDKKAKIKFIVNKDYSYTKVFDNILINGDMLDGNRANVTKGLIDYIKFGTKHLEATLNDPIVFDYREDNYRLPIPRQDNNQDTSTYAARLRGKYLECEYHMNTNDNATFRIPFITTTYRYSLL